MILIIFLYFTISIALFIYLKMITDTLYLGVIITFLYTEVVSFYLWTIYFFFFLIWKIIASMMLYLFIFFFFFKNQKKMKSITFYNPYIIISIKGKYKTWGYLFNLLYIFIFKPWDVGVLKLKRYVYVGFINMYIYMRIVFPICFWFFMECKYGYLYFIQKKT